MRRKSLAGQDRKIIIPLLLGFLCTEQPLRACAGSASGQTGDVGVVFRATGAHWHRRAT